MPAFFLLHCPAVCSAHPVTASPPGTTILEARNVASVRGDLRLFAGVGFTLEAGGLLLVQGQNGSGKTTLLRTLAGLSRPAEGDVRWCGEEIRSLGEEYTRELLFIGHANALKDEFSAEENLAFARELSGRSSTPAELSGALAHVGLASRARLPARFLSQGQKRRVALARLCLAADTPLWILDEPFAALDAAGLDTVAALVNGHLARGGMAVLTTHQAVAIEAPRRHVVVLEG